MTPTEMLRAVKAIQTQTLVHREALSSMTDTAYGGATNRSDAQLRLHDQLKDTLNTAENHIDALQHVIIELTS